MYKYAQGHPILHPSGFLIQLSRPLDFYAVTDHGVFMGLMKEAGDTSSEFSKYELTEPIHNLNKSVNNGLFSLIRRSGLFRPFGEAVRKGLADGTIDGSIVEEVGRSAWEETIKAADEAYAPGTFYFCCYEYTSALIFMKDIFIEMSYLKIQMTSR